MVKHVVSMTLAGLIVCDFPCPIPLLARVGESGPAVAVVSGLSITSDPLAASVYVDGLFAGRTPVTMNVLVGEHRVRMAKGGYLEHSRVVSVSAGRATNVQVRLTPHAASPPAPMARAQGGVGSAGGGSGSRLPWLLAGLGGGFVAGFLYEKSKSSDTAAPANRAPVAGSATATPQKGLVSFSSIGFAAAGPNDPDGDSLTFDWDFGDLTSHSAGASPSHIYTSAVAAGFSGTTYTARVTVGDGKGGSASATVPVTIKSLTGTWKGILAGNTAFDATLTLTQTGANITGTYSDTSANNGTVTGLASSGALTIAVTVAANQPFVYTAAPDVNVDALTGTVNGSGFTNASWPLARQ